MVEDSIDAKPRAVKVVMKGVTKIVHFLTASVSFRNLPDSTPNSTKSAKRVLEDEQNSNSLVVQLVKVREH